jgi:hypothetical protein
VADDDGAASGTPVQTKEAFAASGNTATATYDSAFGTGNHALSIGIVENAEVHTVQSSWTELAAPSVSGIRFMMSYRLSDAVTTAVATFTPAGNNVAVIGIEIDAAGGGSTQPPRTYYSNRRRR